MEQTDVKTLQEIIMEVEGEYNLFNFELSKISYWACQRDLVYRLVNEKKSNVKVYSGKRKKGIKGITALIRDELKCIFHCCKKKQTEVLFVAHPRRGLYEGKYECLYTSQIAERFKDSVTMEFYSFHGHSFPPAEEHTLYMDRYQLWPEFLAYTGKKLGVGLFAKYKAQMKSECEVAIKKILKEYGLEEAVSDSIIAAMARRQVAYYHKKSVFKNILKKLSPKVIVEVISISPNVSVLNDAAHELGISVVEMQHGPVDETFFHYNYGKEKVHPQFPDDICVFSKYWKDFSHMPIADEKIHVTGYPYFERTRKKYLKDDLAETTANEDMAISEKPEVICFLSQPTIGKWLSEFASELIDIIGIDLIKTRIDNENMEGSEFSELKIENKDRLQFRIIYKLHPSEFNTWRTDYPKLSEQEKAGLVEVVDGNGKPLYEVLAQSDIQVGVHSTSVFEGLGFGLKTYIYKTLYSETMKNLCKAGYAEYVESPQELYDRIRTPAKNSVGAFWETDSVEKEEAVIRHFL